MCGSRKKTVFVLLYLNQYCYQDNITYIFIKPSRINGELILEKRIRNLNIKEDLFDQQLGIIIDSKV